MYWDYSFLSFYLFQCTVFLMFACLFLLQLNNNNYISILALPHVRVSYQLSSSPIYVRVNKNWSFWILIIPKIVQIMQTVKIV